MKYLDNPGIHFALNQLNIKIEYPINIPDYWEKYLDIIERTIIGYDVRFLTLFIKNSVVFEDRDDTIRNLILEENEELALVELFLYEYYNGWNVSPNVGCNS